MSGLLRIGLTGAQDWDKALEEALRTSSELLDVERVSYWSFRTEPPSIVSELGYVRSLRLFERGALLLERAAPTYFAEARRTQILSIDDAAHDPRLAGLESYVERNRIGALLDVPIYAMGSEVGILCHEHVGGPRAWAPREATLALGTAQTLTALLEARARTAAQHAEQRASFLAHVTEVLPQTLDPEVANEEAVKLAVPMLGDIVTLIAYDGERAWRVAQLHRDPAQQPVLEELTRNYGGELTGPGIGVQVLRDDQSVLIPMTDPETLHAYGLAAGHVELLERLHVRSVMAVPLRVRGKLTGVLTIASTSSNYDREDLRFAETYARKVALLLSNVQLYAQAQEAVRARDEFISLAAHELRTPLTSLKLASALLDQEVPADARYRAAIDVVVRQAARLTRLSELLLAGSASGDRRRSLHLERLDLAALVRQQAMELHESFARAGSPLHVHANGPVCVEGDARALRVVVASLLDNALKFGAGQAVDVSVEQVDGAGRLTVRDRGVGIPADQKPTWLFGRFERGVPAEHFGGLGLGLHTSFDIVSAHGGTIRAESRPGKGASFIVDLPVDHAESPSMARSGRARKDGG